MLRQLNCTPGLTSLFEADVACFDEQTLSTDFRPLTLLRKTLSSRNKVLLIPLDKNLCIVRIKEFLHFLVFVNTNLCRLRKAKNELFSQPPTSAKLSN